MNNVMVIGAGVSFLIGFLGYIILIFWIRPIWRFKKIKKITIHDLTEFLNSITSENEGDTVNGAIKACAEKLRRHSNNLTESYYGSLPVWYKILLQSRGESIEDAAKHLMGLANTRNYDHAKNRAVKIQQSLKF